MYILDTKSDESFYILYKDNQKFLMFSKSNSLENIIKALKMQGYDFKII